MKTEKDQSESKVATREAVAQPPTRRRYEAPRIESGEAFEKVHLASNCNNFDPLEGCDLIC